MGGCNDCFTVAMVLRCIGRCRDRLYRNFWDRKAVFFLEDMGYCIALSVTVSFTAKCNLYHWFSAFVIRTGLEIDLSR